MGDEVEAGRGVFEDQRGLVTVEAVGARELGDGGGNMDGDGQVVYVCAACGVGHGEGGRKEAGIGVGMGKGRCGADGGLVAEVPAPADDSVGRGCVIGCRRRGKGERAVFAAAGGKNVPLTFTSTSTPYDANPSNAIV